VKNFRGDLFSLFSATQRTICEIPGSGYCTSHKKSPNLILALLNE
jgi:hypothetical protein